VDIHTLHFRCLHISQEIVFKVSSSIEYIISVDLCSMWGISVSPGMVADALVRFDRNCPIGCLGDFMYYAVKLSEFNARCQGLLIQPG
jgi:hypothetical protein